MAPWPPWGHAHVQIWSKAKIFQNILAFDHIWTWADFIFEPK